MAYESFVKRKEREAAATLATVRREFVGRRPATLAAFATLRGLHTQSVANAASVAEGDPEIGDRSVASVANVADVETERLAPLDERAAIGAGHNQTQPHPDDSDADEWLAFFDERAGIAEFDGGLSRAGAEGAAYQFCLLQWQYRNPLRSQPTSCCQCGAPERAGDVLLAVGLAPNQVWLHDGCWSAWRAVRVAQAEAFLATIGIRRKP